MAIGRFLRKIFFIEKGSKMSIPIKKEEVRKIVADLCAKNNFIFEEKVWIDGSAFYEVQTKFKIKDPSRGFLEKTIAEVIIDHEEDDTISLIGEESIKRQLISGLLARDRK